MTRSAKCPSLPAEDLQRVHLGLSVVERRHGPVPLTTACGLIQFVVDGVIDWTASPLFVTCPGCRDVWVAAYADSWVKREAGHQ